MQGISERKDPLREQYALRIERAAVLALLLLIGLFLGFKRLALERPREPVRVALSVVVEEIPATRQGSRRPPPRKPAVPIPAESEMLPEDEVIEPEQDWLQGLGEAASTGQSERIGGALLYLPRAIRDVIPEFPEKLRGKVRGYIKLMLRVDPSGRVAEVLVVENTTGSDELQRAAVAAAKRCLFVPPRDERGRKVSVWVPKIYRFQ